MKLKDINQQDCRELFSSASGLSIAIGPFHFNLKSQICSVSDNFYKLYADFPLLSSDSLTDFFVRVDKPHGLRRWIKPQVLFYCDDRSPFLPLPYSQAYPLLEWGMNWCIAQHSHHYLMLHAAVLRKNSITVILPAESGSGKSTLTALLINNGWQLYSDEMALIDTETLKLRALARPVSLKNQSIDIVKNLNKDFIFSTIVDDTNKGTITHLKPHNTYAEKSTNTASATHIIFPKYETARGINVNSKNKSLAFMQVVKNSFNYGLLGEIGFDTLDRIINQCECFDLTYSDNQEAINFFSKLT